MASHCLKPLYAIKECSSCGSLYTRECCSIGGLENKILVLKLESSPCCAKCGTPIDGPYCRGCAFLRKKFEKDLLTYCGENETSKDFEDISESSDDNTNVVNAPRELFVVNQDLSVKFRGEKIDEEYERDCEIRIQKLKQDFNEWGSEVRKKEQAYEEEQYAAARHRMLSIPFVDEDDYIPLGDIIARYSTSKAITPIDPILEEFAGELAHIALIPPGIVEADFDPNDDTLSDDDSFENIEYVDASPSYSELDSLDKENEDQEEKEFNLEDIFQIQDVILREKLLNVHRLISNIESLKDKPTPDHESDILFSLDNSLPEFETFSDHTEETRSGSTTTHANYSFPMYDSFLFEIEPDQEVLISIDNSNNILLELPEFESFHFNPSFPRPPPEPPDVEKCFEPKAGVKTPFLTPVSSLRVGGLSSGWNFHVRIYQISQENRQKRANTDTRNGRAQESKITRQKPEKVKLQSKVVKESKKVNS
ncbi:hypothetical protein Tco_0826451 [Tanacetum coccineum]